MNIKAILVMIILLAVIGGGGFYFGLKYKLVPADTSVVTVPTVASTPLVAPTGTTTPVLTQTPSPTVDETAAILTAVKAGIIAERGPESANLNFTVSKIIGNYAQGGAAAQGGGAMWLAAKVGGTWKLVWDGNGTISCASIDPYNFPVSMVPECWNETTGKSVTR